MTRATELIEVATELEQEVHALRAALKDLWTGTVWGAGKGAVFEHHRAVMLRAGIEDIGE